MRDKQPKILILGIHKCMVRLPRGNLCKRSVRGFKHIQITEADEQQEDTQDDQKCSWLNYYK